LWGIDPSAGLMSLQQYARNGRVVIASGAKQSTSAGFAFS
jgi:hypothetical protein